MTEALLKQFRDMAYLPWNNMLSVVQDAASSRLDDLLAAVDDIDARGRTRLDEATPEQVLVFEWHIEALRELARQYAAGRAAGTAPMLAGYSRAALETLCTYICTLTVKPFMGIEPPPPTHRCSPGPSGTLVIDIVPADPRWGWDDIPDWRKP